MRQQRHDAFKNALRQLLDSGVLGLRDKVAPHIAVVVGADQLTQPGGQPGSLPGAQQPGGLPGGLPAVSLTTGVRLPASLVRRWVCDSAIGRFVLSLGGRVIETSHTERTLKPHERRIKKIETGNCCQIAGCRCRPGPGRANRLVPHHPDGYAKCGSTSLGDTVWICDRNHHDLHTGNKTLRLRDGRWLNEHGWTDGPAR